jgi:hypothetical protein
MSGCHFTVPACVDFRLAGPEAGASPESTTDR